ncbi:MAG: PLP-dependent aminotransferase family protein [Thermomicrobiales bacterium]
MPKSQSQPLHLGLAEDLIARIERGEWADGQRLPSVRELASEFSMSTFTVSRAIRQLTSAGRVQTIQGKGTFVVPERTARALTPFGDEGQNGRLPVDLSWQNALLRKPASTRASQIVQPLIRSSQLSSDMIVLASGGETSDVLPAHSLQAAWKGLLGDVKSDMIGGWAAEGELQTREWIVQYLTGMGIATTPDNVIVTSGGQQALSLVAQTLLEPDDTVLVERPMYLFALSILDSLGVRCIDVAVDEDGTWVDAAEDLIERFHPKLVLTVPTGQVPTGITMPTNRRMQLLAAARKHGIIVLEDDHASEMNYEGAAPPAIKSFDTHGHVIYAKSFSKITLPALRIGAIVAEGLILDALKHAKLISDRYTSTIIQSAFLAYVNRTSFPRDLQRYRTIYGERRDAMLDALQREMPDGVTWTHPAAGFHLWLTMPPGISAQEVAVRAAANGVLVARGGAFFAQGDPDTGVRLTFTSNDPERIRLGIQRLARAVEDAMRGGRGHDTLPRLSDLGLT